MDTRRREGKPAPLEKSITRFSYMLFFSSLRYIGDMKSHILSLLRGAFLFVWGAFALPPTTKIFAGKHMRPPLPPTTLS